MKKHWIYKKISEAVAKRSCIAYSSAHDRNAKKQYEENSCGFCGTEDCNCDGFDEVCDCSPCNTLFNKLEKTGYCDNKTFNDIRKQYQDPRSEHEFCEDEDILDQCSCSKCDP
jgi:hypothetical protein